MERHRENLFLHAGIRDVFPRLDELKKKNRDCSTVEFPFRLM